MSVMEADIKGVDAIEIIDAAKIRKALIIAACGSDNIEWQINNRTRIFFTFLAEYQNPRRQDKITQLLNLKGDSNTLFRYLDDGSTLFFNPLHPALGNGHLKPGDRILFRFFKGVIAYEGEVIFQGTSWSLDGSPVLRTSYPKALTLLTKRRHYRARVPQTLEMSCHLISKNKYQGKRCNVLDISIGGASICNPLPPEELMPGTKVSLTLETPEMETLTLSGYVRGHAPLVENKDLCDSDSDAITRCGIQFDIPTAESEMKVGRFVTLAQRESLKIMRNVRRHQRSNGSSPCHNLLRRLLEKVM